MTQDIEVKSPAAWPTAEHYLREALAKCPATAPVSEFIEAVRRWFTVAGAGAVIVGRGGDLELRNPCGRREASPALLAAVQEVKSLGRRLGLPGTVGESVGNPT